MIRFFAAHPTAANLLMVALLAMGAFSIPSLRRETLPDFSADVVQVSAVYPGATAEEVEEAICRRIEEECDDVENIKEVRSEAREGIGIVEFELKEGESVSQFIEDIKTEVESIDDFPEVTEVPIVKPINRTDQVVSIAVTGPMSVPHLKAYCEEIKERLQAKDGVSLVRINGFSEHQIRIEIPSETLMQYGLSVDRVAEIVAGQSVDLPAGDVKTQDRDFLVRFTDERKSPKDFENLIVVGGSEGGEVRLGDIARITDRFELDEEKVIFNGDRAGILQITKTKTEDTLDIYDDIAAFIEEERPKAPPGVEFFLTQDVSSIVRDRLQLLTKNGLQGLCLVLLVMWLFFSFKFSFWVAMGLPVSFMGAFFFFPIVGISINMISMVGLLLATGLLMDDAIVLSENVATHLARGTKPLKAVVEGVSEVKAGVIASFTTTVCVFGPLSFVKGDIGKVLKVMPMVLILVLCISLIEAFLILPHHLAHSLRSHDPHKKNRTRQRFDSILEWVRERSLGRSVDFSVRWRYLTIGLVLGFFLLSISLVAGGVVKIQAFPDLDGDLVAARVLLPQGTPLSKTETIVKRLVETLEEVNREFKPRQPGGQDLVRNVIVQYGANVDAYEQGPHLATVTVDLLTAEKRNARIDDIVNSWREKVGVVPDVLNLKFAEPMIGPGGRAMDIQLAGEPLETLGDAAHEMARWLEDFPGVYDVNDDLRPGKPEFRVTLREGATSLGLSAMDVARQIRSALYGRTANEIQVGVESYEIDVRLAEEDRDSLADLEYLHITLPGGGQIPVGSVAQLESGRSFARIARVDGRRTVSVQAEVDSRKINTGEVLEKLREEYLPTLEERHPNLEVRFRGEAEESAETQASMRRGFLIGILGVFILLSFQFRTYLEPLVVMVAIPLSLIGVIWGHFLMRLDLTMPSIMGFVSLAGVVVNDSILLVQFIKIQRAKGLPIPLASMQASRDRFRAVLLTSLTTIAGLLPLLSERSLQAQILVPLATSIVFGLFASTALVLVVVPSLYSIIGDFGWTEKIEFENEETTLPSEGESR